METSSTTQNYAVLLRTIELVLGKVCEQGASRQMYNEWI